MGLLDRLLRKPAFLPTEGAPANAVMCQGHGTVHVVGESNYQQALERICGGRGERGAHCQVTAVLRLEPTNPYDSNAVRVEVGDRLVGYLSRPDALSYGSVLRTLDGRGLVAACCATVNGGWLTKEDEGQFGVVLDLAEPASML